MERGTEVRPGSDEPDDAHAEQDEVVEDAARLQNRAAGGEEFAKFSVRGEEAEEVIGHLFAVREEG